MGSQLDVSVVAAVERDVRRSAAVVRTLGLAVSTSVSDSAGLISDRDREVEMFGRVVVAAYQAVGARRGLAVRLA